MVINIKIVSNIFWLIFIIIILYSSIYFSIKLKLPQFNIKNIVKTLLKKENINGISSIDTLFISLASKIGIGSLSGIAFAIYYGGIGSLFWIWIFTFLISIFSFLENYLAIIYKEKDNSFYKGGPSYYIKKGLNNKTLSLCYAIILIFTYLVGFLTIQNNTITKLININYNISNIYISFIVILFSTYFIFKGLKSISNLCNKIVPLMSIIYLILGLIVVILNINDLSLFFKDVITNAFNYQSLIGGSFLIGIQKSIFSSEAGLGTGAIASGATSSNDATQQGYIGIISTYFINIVIATITGIIIYFSNYENFNLININGIELTSFSFSFHFGNFGKIMLLTLIIFFAFSTIITGYYYCESNLKLFITNKWIISLFKVLSLIILFFGGIFPSFIIWNIIDVCIVILFLINLYAIYKLRKKIIIINK